MLSAVEVDALLMPQYGKFFITRVQDMLQLISLPVPPSRSTNHSFIFLTAGEAIMSIGNEKYNIHKNQGLWVSAGQVFSFSNLDRNEGFICNFNDDFLVGRLGYSDFLKNFEFLNIWSNPCLQPGKKEAQSLLLLLKRMLEIYSDSGLKENLILQAYTVTLLSEIQGIYSQLNTAGQSTSSHLAAQFKSLVYHQIKKHHFVTDYANLLHVTPNHLNKVVKAATGKSPSKWIDETLILEAKVLLYQTQYSIGEICTELGIEDPAYFSRFFKKYEKVSPAEFRKLIEKSKNQPDNSK